MRNSEKAPLAAVTTRARGFSAACAASAGDPFAVVRERHREVLHALDLEFFQQFARRHVPDADLAAGGKAVAADNLLAVNTLEFDT